MKKIPLGSHSDIERYALVDDEDFESVNQFKWHASGETWGIRYALRTAVIAGEPTPIQMHKFILGVGSGQMVEHKNRNGHDNRRKNLRPCTPSQNQAGRKIGKNNKTGYKGVYWREDRGCYMAQIYKNSKRHYLGRYDNPIDAAKAYNEAAIEFYGEFAFENKF